MSSIRGLRLLKAIENYTKSKPNQLDTSTVFKKVKLLQAGEGRLSGKILVEAGMCNAGDTLHGGYVASLVDVFSVFGCLSHPSGKVCWTTAINIVYIEAAKKGDEVLVEAAPLGSIGRSSVMEVTLRNQTSGAVLAKGVASLVAGHDRWQASAAGTIGYYSGIFIFGSQILPPDVKRDAISTLPLELSWLIFSYLDNASLRAATFVCPRWRTVILAYRELRTRLERYDMAITLGSEKLELLFRRNKRKARRRTTKLKQKSYYETFKVNVESIKRTTWKRGGDILTIYSKRMKLL